MQIRGRNIPKRILDDEKLNGIEYYTSERGTFQERYRGAFLITLRAFVFEFLKLLECGECDVQSMDHFLMCTRVLVGAECHIEMYHLFALYGIIKKTVTGGIETFTYKTLHGLGTVWNRGMTCTLAEMQVLDVFDWKVSRVLGPGALACEMLDWLLEHYGFSGENEWTADLTRKLMHGSCLECLYEQDFNLSTENISFRVAERVLQKSQVRVYWEQSKNEICKRFKIQLPAGEETEAGVSAP